MSEALHRIAEATAHFTLDPTTEKKLVTASKKRLLTQDDHNSIVYTFELPRYIFGHDMSACNVAQVHYTNIEAKQPRRTSEGVYEISDLAIGENGDTITFSWSVQDKATMYAGALSFLLKFKCIDEDDELLYKYNTEPYDKLTVGTGKDNGEAVIAQSTDYLESWKASVLADVTELIEETETELNALKSSAQSAASGAMNSMIAAGQYADSASEQAASAGNSASAASGAASDAAGSALNAESSADRAEASESQAKTYAENAEASKEDAQDYADAALSYRDSAQSAANSAAESADDAETAKDSAVASANAASSYASEAAGYKNTAQAQAEAAASSASQASSYSSYAQGFANSASGSAIGAENAATRAEEAADRAEAVPLSVDTIYSNAIKGEASGAIIRVNDVSPNKHSLNVSVKGKNMIPAFPIDKAVTRDELTQTVSAGGQTITLNGTTASTGGGRTFFAHTAIPIHLEKGKTYTLSHSTVSGTSTDIYSVYLSRCGDNARVTSLNSYTASITFTPEEDTECYIGINTQIGETYTNLVVRFMLEEGSTASTYEEWIDPTTVTLTRCGKNILPYPFPASVATTKNGITITDNGDGSITINGTAEGTTTFNLISSNIKVKGKYILSGMTGGSGTTYYVQPFVDGTSYGGMTDGYRAYEFPDGEITQIKLTVVNGTTMSNVTCKFMLEVGDVATEHEQYEGDTFTPSADGTVEDIKSVSTALTLYTDNGAAIIDCEYNKDANKVINDLKQDIQTLDNDLAAIANDLESAKSNIPNTASFSYAFKETDVEAGYAPSGYVKIDTPYDSDFSVCLKICDESSEYCQEKHARFYCHSNEKEHQANHFIATDFGFSIVYYDGDYSGIHTWYIPYSLSEYYEYLPQGYIMRLDVLLTFYSGGTATFSMVRDSEVYKGNQITPANLSLLSSKCTTLQNKVDALQDEVNTLESSKNYVSFSKSFDASDSSFGYIKITLPTRSDFTVSLQIDEDSYITDSHARFYCTEDDKNTTTHTVVTDLGFPNVYATNVSPSMGNGPHEWYIAAGVSDDIQYGMPASVSAYIAFLTGKPKNVSLEYYTDALPSEAKSVPVHKLVN